MKGAPLFFWSFMSTNIYVATSWRNPYQPKVIEDIRAYGKLKNIDFNVYDFRHPSPNSNGFSWDKIDKNWKNWTVDEYKQALRHPLAQEGFELDREALQFCDICLLVLPCGASAHLEAGWAGGIGSSVIIYAPDLKEAELMYKLFDYDTYTPIYDDMASVLEVIGNHSD